MRWFRILMILLMLAVIGWLAWSTRASLAAVDWLDPAVLGALAVMLITWILSQSVAGLAWWLLLGRSIAARIAVGLLLATQVGKYLPGNVGQFVGRAYLARRYGVALTASGASITAEGFLGILAGLGLGLAMLAFDPGGTAALVQFLPEARVIFLLLGGCVIALVLLLVFPDLIRRILPAGSRLQRLVPPALPPLALALAAALHLGLIVILGFGLWLAIPVFADLGAAPAVPLSVAIAVFGVANVAGFVTPGAPGGLGVREVVIVGGLGPYIGADPAMVVALTLRAATVLGDVAICAIGWAMLPAAEPDGAARELSGQP